MYGTKQTPKTGFSRKRIEQLSTPKESKQEWSTGFDNWQLRWGDKDSMWQIRNASKTAKAKPRTRSPPIHIFVRTSFAIKFISTTSQKSRLQQQNKSAGAAKKSSSHQRKTLDVFLWKGVAYLANKKTSYI